MVYDMLKKYPKRDWFHHRTGENQIMTQLRMGELENPSSIGHKTIKLLKEGLKTTDISEVGNVPVSKIVGFDQLSHLQIWEENVTFHDLLFLHLHGASLIPDTLDYYVGDGLKADSKHLNEEYVECPNKTGIEASASARRGVSFLEYNGEYYVEQGRHRTILAMFYITQSIGESGVIKKVDITKLVK